LNQIDHVIRKKKLQNSTLSTESVHTLWINRLEYENNRLKFWEIMQKCEMH